MIKNVMYKKKYLFLRETEEYNIFWLKIKDKKTLILNKLTLKICVLLLVDAKMQMLKY